MTYEYVCEACGHQWEAEQSIKDRPLQKCVSCSELKAKRLISGGTGFLLKGGGWYADLYGSPGSGSPKSADKDGKAAAPAAKTDGSETKSPSDGKSSSKDGAAAASSSPSSGSSSPSGSASSSASTPSAKAS